MNRMWMVRSDGGDVYEHFRAGGVVAVGWPELAEQAVAAPTREALMQGYRALHPHDKPGSVAAAASQLWRFVHLLQVGDWVVSYSPGKRSYAVGRVAGVAECRPDWLAACGKDAQASLGESYPLVRRVQWQGREVLRDRLPQATRNSLGSTLTVFEVPDHTRQDLLAELGLLQDGRRARPDTSGGTGVADGMPSDEQAMDVQSIDVQATDVELQALERIKDNLVQLSWDDMQRLVAGILRAMGYKTQVSPAGADRGRDIVASPDGFGFEQPRIVVEVKHRSQSVDSAAIRSFLGGRHSGDRGLFVSTGGFTKDARYEAERAAIPLALWTLDELVRTLMEHYDNTDEQTKRIVPLRRLYWPA